ncbi:hypothetical protein FGIG_05958 [Fasciola gigantica]|uniref:Uncharacterized protein n=1 Tax=Fasciola gigantica TaxID=46835 RepID=A0A504YZ45_FASGI|nr:hypothetical protein FGIG_05958 [Fasciola gigantica]
MDLLNELDVVWEALCDMDGNTRSVDAALGPYKLTAADLSPKLSLTTHSTARSFVSSSFSARPDPNYPSDATKSQSTNATLPVKPSLFHTLLSSSPAGDAGWSGLEGYQIRLDQASTKCVRPTNEPKKERQTVVLELACRVKIFALRKRIGTDASSVLNCSTSTGGD